MLEINPVTLELVWSYVAPAQFYSSNISGAQRLPNGNTLDHRRRAGRLFEVTRDGTIVWEYMSPFFGDGPAAARTPFIGAIACLTTGFRSSNDRMSAR